jgi:hypothetical protein
VDRHFVTPSGTTVHVFAAPIERAPNRDGAIRTYHVSSAATSGPVSIYIDAPVLTAASLRDQTGIQLTDQLFDRLAVSAILAKIDADPEFIGRKDDEFQIAVTPDNIVEFANRPRLSDRELRRYIARKVYDAYSRSEMAILVDFDEFDEQITGASRIDLLRNAQVLQQEGYVKLERTMGEANFELIPQARLVRDVERYGSAKDDAVSDQDYAGALHANSQLAECRDRILYEYQRYGSATSSVEIASVFRSIAPLVEGVLRAVLTSHGVTRDLPNLGRMIAEVQKRGIGTSHLLSQLNHILKFGRDLEGHGNELPDSVLRIACANAFELVPQLGALFKPETE